MQEIRRSGAGGAHKNKKAYKRERTDWIENEINEHEDFENQYNDFSKQEESGDTGGGIANDGGWSED